MTHEAVLTMTDTGYMRPYTALGGLYTALGGLYTALDPSVHRPGPIWTPFWTRSDTVLDPFLDQFWTNSRTRFNAQAKGNRV